MMRLLAVLLSLVVFSAMGVSCRKDARKDKKDTSALASNSSTGQKIVQVNGKHPGPKVMHDGSPAHIVDMRLRAPLVMEGVKPVGESWQPGGRWNVHEITYRDGGLKFELAFELPEADTKLPVKSRARLRWLSGDAHAFLKAMAYVFQANIPHGGQGKGKFVAFDMIIQTTSAKDVGTMKMETNGGDWTVAKASVVGADTASFQILLLPTKGLGRFVPVPGESSKVVMGLFAKALL